MQSSLNSDIRKLENPYEPSVEFGSDVHDASEKKGNQKILKEPNDQSNLQEARTRRNSKSVKFHTRSATVEQ